MFIKFGSKFILLNKLNVFKWVLIVLFKMECWYDFGESDVRLLSSIVSISGWILTELTEKRCFDGDRS